MKLYKFRDFNNIDHLSHLREIILEKKIWCASPDSLNDEEEFKSELDCTPTTNTANLLAQQIRQNRPIDSWNIFPPDYVAKEALKNNLLESHAKTIFDDLVQQTRKGLGITSFASTVNSTLWERYGGNGNGAYVEIDVPNLLLGKIYHRVPYVPKKIIHIDALLAGTLSNYDAYQAYKMLLTKTDKWSDEEEIRFIGGQQNAHFALDGYVSAVVLGSKIPHDIRDKFLSEINSHCKSNDISIAILTGDI